MPKDLTAADLRRLADMLDALNQVSSQTGVIVEGYGESYITIKDHVIRLNRQRDTGGEDIAYTVEWPDKL